MSDKVRQQKIEDMKRIKAAYEEAKKKGLVTSRPITLDEQGRVIQRQEDTTDL